ncbi:MAG: universal stress protein [Verrucomicrobia bacterium]|nr:universal stress protein [Verrucomicrobiota bacterium]MBU4290468.1 universal stress protein [Verrucomicrobiota bacterium]MBU4430048.1 universal stress protein [Verrucomicrobiota bacterium]MCG2681125.1 universal stress protein [Kiritimatiellia bacterium]
MYKKILIATDGTAHSASAIIEATEMARKYGSEIYLLHVLSRIIAIDPLGGSSVVITQQLHESTRKFLETFKGMATEDGVMKFETIVRQGELFYRTILDEAVSRQADLIMMGRRESSLMKRLLFQSLTTQLLFYAPCPVLIVPLAALIQWERIILAVNGNRASAPALAETLKIAKTYGSHVTAAIKPPRRGGLAAAEDVSRSLKTSAEQAGVALDTVILSAIAADEIARLAKERDADMIITGQPDESILKHIFQGSFPEQIIDKSLCSVLVVPGAVSRAAARTEPTIS